MTKQFRQGRIAAILRKGKVTSQGELAQRLRASNVIVSQATLSRDLREMGVIWKPEGYDLPEQLGSTAPVDDPSRRLREFVRSAAPAGTLAVLRSDPGCAHPLAVAIDRASWGEVVGTIAGDDTVFVAAASAADAKRVVKRIRKIVS
jgi:transcriptional regulator of arginine metabolism